MTIEQAFGNVVRKLRKERKFSQEKLAFTSMLDRTFISSLECGRKQPTLITIFQLADALNVAASKILSEVELLLSHHNISVRHSINSSVKVYPGWGDILNNTSFELCDRYRGTETILLVDDEESLLSMLDEFMTDFGYNVLAASDGMNALDIFKERSDDINLIVMDVIMPRLDGVKAYKEMVKIKPDVNVLFMSAYAANCFSDFDSGFNFVKKPLSPFDLIDKVRECIDKGSNC